MDVVSPCMPGDYASHSSASAKIPPDENNKPTKTAWDEHLEHVCAEWNANAEKQDVLDLTRDFFTNINKLHTIKL